jgi:hypothetical protein
MDMVGLLFWHVYMCLHKAAGLNDSPSFLWLAFCMLRHMNDSPSFLWLAFYMLRHSCLRVESPCSTSAVLALFARASIPQASACSTLFAVASSSNSVSWSGLSAAGGARRPPLLLLELQPSKDGQSFQYSTSLDTLPARFCAVYDNSLNKVRWA